MAQMACAPGCYRHDCDNNWRRNTHAFVPGQGRHRMDFCKISGCGLFRDHPVHKNTTERSQEMPSREQLERELERAESRADRIAARLVALEGRPEEPEVEGGDLPVIRFDLRMGGTAVYSYAAIKCEGGWFTTGPQSPKFASWDELMDFIDRHTLVDGLWVGTEWVAL